MPQFNPELGQLQSVELTLGVLEAAGSASFNYPGIPDECLNTPFLNDCASIPLTVAYTATISSGNLASLTFGDNEVLAVNYCCLAGPVTAPWSDSQFSGGVTGLGSGILDYNAARAGPFIGNGQLTFDITTSVSDYNGNFLYNPFNPGFDGASASVDFVNYGQQVEYDFTPTPTPEPSLFFVTGAGLLGLLAMRFRRKSA